MKIATIGIMNLSGRIRNHLLFWITYSLVLIYNELFLSASFSREPTFHLFMGAVASHTLLLLVKIPLVYFVTAYLIPQWYHPGRGQKRRQLVVAGMVVLVFALVVYRFIVQQVIWPYIYHETPGIISPLQMVARYIYSLLDLLLVVAIAVSARLIRMKMESEKQSAALIRERAQAELLLLKSQVHPHFLFNSLNTIYALIRTDTEIASDAILRLSGIMRYLLTRSGSERVQLKEEIELLRDYVSLQQLRFGDRIEIRFEAPEPEANLLIAPLIFLPLTENAFKHGTRAMPEQPPVITIRIECKGYELSFETINPATENFNRTDTGTGLLNVKRQLGILYPGYVMSYGRENENFVLSLKINLSAYAGSELFGR